MAPESIKKFLSSNNKIKTYLMIAAIAIIALLLIGTDSGGSSIQDNNTTTISFDDEYRVKITDELIKTISQIKGVGKVSVMVTVESSYRYVYSEDIQKTMDSKKTETVILQNKEALLQRIEAPTIGGVLVVCSGGDNPAVKEKVINAVSTVLDISSSKVYVTSSN